MRKIRVFSGGGDQLRLARLPGAGRIHLPNCCEGEEQSSIFKSFYGSKDSTIVSEFGGNASSREPVPLRRRNRCGIGAASSSACRLQHAGGQRRIGQARSTALEITRLIALGTDRRSSTKGLRSKQKRTTASPSFMLIAGEPSEISGAEFVRTFGQLPDVLIWPWPPEFFGAGGPQMTAAGVRLELDLTAHAVVGFTDVLAQYAKFRAFFNQLFDLALQRQPDVIVLIDFGGFNLRFARASQRHARRRRGVVNWKPKIVYFVSPQVWASREGRAYQLARDVDLLLSIFPFESLVCARVPGCAYSLGTRWWIGIQRNAEYGTRIKRG